MKVYIDVPVERASELRELRDWLYQRGHTLTHDWTLHESDTDVKKATADVQGITSADVLVALLPGGRSFHVEIGVALGCGIPVFIVGDRVDADGKVCVFYSHPLVCHLRSVDELKIILDVPVWPLQQGIVTQVGTTSWSEFEKAERLSLVRQTGRDIGVCVHDEVMVEVNENVIMKLAPESLGGIGLADVIAGMEPKHKIDPGLVLARWTGLSPNNDYAAQAFARYCTQIGVNFHEDFHVTPHHRFSSSYGDVGRYEVLGHRRMLIKHNELGIVTFGGRTPKDDQSMFPYTWLVNADYAFAFSPEGVRVIKDRYGHEISGFRDLVYAQEPTLVPMQSEVHMGMNWESKVNIEDLEPKP